MKYALSILVFPLVLAGGSGQQANEQKSASARSAVDRQAGLQTQRQLSVAKPAEHYMQRAWYEYGTSQSQLPVTSKNAFVVVADASCKAKDFVSSAEQWLRQRLAARADTAALYAIIPWRELAPQQRQTRLKQEQTAYQRQADSLHTANNKKGTCLVWLLNNSADVITLGTQAASLICVV